LFTSFVFSFLQMQQKLSDVEADNKILQERLSSAKQNVTEVRRTNEDLTKKINDMQQEMARLQLTHAQADMQWKSTEEVLERQL
jgi:peptidoglycan hydrolase CwlO-like protein